MTYNYLLINQMIKSLCLIILLLALVQSQTVTHYYILPVETTRNALTSYSFLFGTDTRIASNAQVNIQFPFEFRPKFLNRATRVQYAIGNGPLQVAVWSINIQTFTIEINQIPIGNITVVIDGIRNPKDYRTSSTFIVQTLFKSVVVTQNSEFGRVPFTQAPVSTAGGTFFNYQNQYIEQGATWTFRFTPSKTYPAETSLRFIFPEGFKSNKIQCNVSGVVDPNMITRVFPAQNVYDCLNLKMPLTGAVKVLLSGLVNPDYQSIVTGIEVHILQPNNQIVQEIITSASSVLVKQKPLKTNINIPNMYRNYSTTYVFQINPDTNLNYGDYMIFQFQGLWNIFTNATRIISGVLGSGAYTPTWTVTTDTTTTKTTLKLANFHSILNSQRLTFYQPLVTPLAPNNYQLTISSYRSHGGLAQTYTQSLTINKTTGYIQEMKLHPMQSPIKLPVGKTGPIELVLFLRNNLPKTNVLTYGLIHIDIFPNIPAPLVNLNGVPKCYFYYNIPAANCTFNSSDPTKTVVQIYTPVDFNFQQSQIPLTITTQGFQAPENQGITIDTLVKRYFFEIQFYSHVRPPPVPLEVIFDEWVPDSIAMSSLSCATVIRNVNQEDHIKCTFVTPTQILNDAGHIHYFRVEFGSSSGNSWNIGWVGASNVVTPDYPCLMYGTNVSAIPYVKCDYITWQSGPHKSSLLSTSYSYVTFYGLSTIPGGSTITFQIPKIQRSGSSGYQTDLFFSILEDTPGYTSPLVEVYTQRVSTSTNSGGGSYLYVVETPSITLSNSIINKVTDITLNTYALGVTDPEYVIFEVEQTAFPNIGRGEAITCGTNTCSKFDKPVQYFILYPAAALGSSATITFPAIATPAYSGDFTFRTRVYKSSNTYKKGQFAVTISPEPIVTSSYVFHANQTIVKLYPNSDHFYTIGWTTVNPLITTSGSAKITITINNIFTLSSTHCEITTVAPAYDGRGIICELAASGTQIDLKNIADVPSGTTFTVTLQLRSTSTASTVSPTVNIKTYYGNGALVDQAINVPFGITPLPNQNLVVLTTFTLPASTTSKRAITAGYFGHLLTTFDPVDSGTIVNGSKIILTLPTQFKPATNSLNLPLSCFLNTKQFPCTYTINPFVVSIINTNGSFTTGVNNLNITTEYQNMNGIYYPVQQGRYMLQIEIRNDTTEGVLEKVQQYVDILPPEVAEFKVDWAIKDIGVYNIWTVQFKNGPTLIPSYNDGSNAGRIKIGFPTIDQNNGAVFANDLGFSGITQGSILPCYFQATSAFIGPNTGKNLQCKIHRSYTNNYHVWVQIINFASIPAGGRIRFIMAKVKNPNNKQIDIDFILKVNTININTNVQSQLYYTQYNMFIDMVSKSITNRNQPDSTTRMFQSGASVGKDNQFLFMVPYTGFTFQTNDWWIVDLDTQFPLSGAVLNCQNSFYQYCIVYPTINWLAIKIGNTSLIGIQPKITKLPLSISRVNTNYQAYTFRSGRWSQTITYTVTANPRWLELRGAISNFNYEVFGSQNKLNVGQKDVEVLVSFTTQHIVPKGGSIQIQFPGDSTKVPTIKQHCRSAVTMGSQLYGYDTGKPTVNVQGEIGCTVQNSYSWIITGFAQLPAGSQVIIFGKVDLPTVATSSLGTGYIATFSDQHSSNTFDNAKSIDYLQTDFPIAVQNLTWSLDTSLNHLKTQPLRIGHVGELRFYINFDSTFQCSSFGTGSSGKIYVNLDRLSITGSSGGFGAPPSNLICTMFNPATLLKYGCSVNYYQGNSIYYGYQILTYQNIPANTVMEVTISTLHGTGTEGIPFPTSVGKYKTELQIQYCSSCSNKKTQAQYIEVYGPNWSILEFNSTVTIPNENNFIMVIFKPSASLTTSQQFVIQIPTVSLDGTSLFPADLGMGYNTYDKLVFDLFQSSISSMDCRVYPGKISDQTPTKIICSTFSSTITTSMTVKFGFWVVNPVSSVGMSIPIQVYAYDQPTARKYVWSIFQAGIRILPITTTPTTDVGNFYTNSNYRQISGRDFDFTTRNAKNMVASDWYILKFNFDLRQSINSNSNYHYNSDYAGRGDVIFMENCRTVMLRVGTTVLAIMTPGSTTRNGRINNLFYNPQVQLTTVQASIKAYAIYNSLDQCQRIYYSELFPTLVVNQPSTPTFTLSPIYSTNYRGSLDDWRITFRMDNSAGNSTSLVKYMSIEFPNVSVSDMQLMSHQCVERIDSQFQLQSCNIDITNRMIWIKPVPKTSYNDADYLKIETTGKAIKNGITKQINQNQFTVRYYTWPDSMAMPTIIRGSDDWCFMKQDSTRITSVGLTWTSYYSTYKASHTSFTLPEQTYVNQWQPAHYYINNASVSYNFKKSPFVFKLIAPTTFNSYEGSSNYHYISVNFNGVYSIPAINSKTLDLQYHVPECKLNGFTILKCTISNNIIKMEFQQPIANGQIIGVTMNIINPKNQDDQGFILPNTNNPTTTLPVYIYNRNTGSTYLVNPDPFHTYYKATSNTATYPSFGIQDITMVWGTQVQSQLNYLEFNLTLTRNDINGLVIEIPVIAKDGSPIYNSPTLLGLQSGREYPCSFGVHSPVYCYYEKGSANGFGTPTRIYVTGFNTLSATTIFKMLFTNPDISDVFPSFTFKAFGGSFTTPQLMGRQFMGIHEVQDPFKVYTTVGYYSTGSLTCYPTKSLWQTSTYYDCYTSSEDMSVNTYAIMKWPLVDPTYGTIGDYVYSSGQVYDHFFINQGENKYYVYMVKKLTVGFTAGTSTSSTYNRFGNITSYYRWGKLRMKHHMVNSYQMYLLRQPSTKIYTCSVSVSYMNSYKTSNYFGTWSIYNMDTQVRYSGQNGWQFTSINAGNSMSGYSNNVDDPSEKVVEVQFFSNKPYSSLSTSTGNCLLESGLISNDPLKPITCYLDASNNRILFKNVFWFTNTRLNFYYYATTISDFTAFDVRVYVWANQQAYTNRGWYMYTSTTTSDFTYDSIMYTSNTSYSSVGGSQRPFGNNVMDLPSGNGVASTRILSSGNKVRTEGYSKILAVSSTQIKIRLYSYVSKYQYKTFRMGFRFYTPRLLTTQCSSVTLWTSKWGWIPFNSYAYRSSAISTYCGNAGTNTRRFYAVFDMYYTTSQSRYPYQWPNLSNGDTYDFTFTFLTVSGAATSIYPNYLWVSATMLWQESFRYYRNSICGCWYCSCTRIYGWDYYTFTGTQGVGFSQSPANLVSSTSLSLLSKTYSAQTQFGFYFSSLTKAITNTMTSFTNGAHAQLIIQFNGNVNYPSNNPFPYSGSQSSAYIDCLCIQSTSTINLAANSNYQKGNCTRHIVSGMKPFISLRYNAPVNSKMYCYFPGFKVPSSSGGSSFYVKFYWNPMHYFKNHNIPYHHYSSHMTQSSSLTLTSSTVSSSFQQYNQYSYFWPSNGKVLESKRFYVKMRQSTTISDPLIYYSGYYPKLTQSICSNTNSYYHCRTYDSFVQRRYFMICQVKGSISQRIFDYTGIFPQSKDYANSFYDMYIGWTRDSSASRYWAVKTFRADKNKLTEDTPTYGVAPSLYGSTLKTYSTTFVLTVQLNGHTLYSNQRVMGHNQGSFIKVTASSFSTLYGCGVTLHYKNNRAFYNNALYCKVISNTVINIWSNSDISFTGKMLITFATSSVPTSTNIVFELFDKYNSGSDYGRSISTTVNINNNPSYTILPSTNILWRRQAYRDRRTDATPIRFTLNNIYEYVSSYSMSSHSINTSASAGVIIQTPSTMPSNQIYKCVVREYPPNKYHLYTQYTIQCADWSTVQLLFKSIPSHILKPAFFYQFIAYQNLGAGTSLITTSTAANRIIRVWSSPRYVSLTTQYFNVQGQINYRSTSPFSLNSIYILTREAAVVNSLYIDFTVNIATPSVYWLEFQFDALGLSNFNIQNGDQIPCYLSLSTISAKTKGPICFGFSKGTNSDYPLIVRVVNFAGFSANMNIKLALDNFNNPSLQNLFVVPINVNMKLQDRTNQNIYSAFFPRIFFSDSINVRNTVLSTGNLAPSNTAKGASSYHQWTFGWPYSSSSNVWDKIVMKIDGGIDCCSPFSSMASLSNSGSYLNKLWVNTKANTSVYTMLSRSSGTTTYFRIQNVKNPNPVDFTNYEQGKKVTMIWYSVYKTYNIYQLTQPNYSSYGLNSDFTSGGATYVSGSKPNHWPSHQYYPLTYEFYFDVKANSYNGRNISHILLYFTSGVRWVEDAWLRYPLGVINNVGSASYGFNTANNQWYVNITGVQDSNFHASYHWYLRVRLQANNNNRVYHYTYVYNYNGQQQFATSNSNFQPSSQGFSTSSLYTTPNMWTHQHLRYTHNYYELQRKTLYAKAGQTTNKLFFKFRAPYNISDIQTIDFVSSSSVPASITPDNGIYCTVQPTYTQYVSYGAGFYAPCTYNSGTFTVRAPTGGMVMNKEYLVTIIDRRQLTTTFSMPTTPQRIQISLIFKSSLSLAYGDVYTLDFSAHMSNYAVSHSHLMSGYYDMLGFTFRPSFALSAASVSSPITQSVLSFEVESKYYDTCLGIANIFAPDNMPFYSGVYYSHFTDTPVANANTRIMCGMNTQNQNWAPAILSITDYGALSTSSSYYFRFPLITLPSGTNVPLTYRVRLLSYANGMPYPTVISEYRYEAKEKATGATSNANQHAYLSLSNSYVQKTMSISYTYSNSGGNMYSGAQTVVKFKNNFIPALTSLGTLTSVTNSNFAYEYYPNINLALFRYTGGSYVRGFSLGTYPTSNDQQTFQVSFVQTYYGTGRRMGWFHSNSNTGTYTVTAASSWTTTSFTKGTNLLTTNSWDKYTVTWSANYLTFLQGSRMIVTFNNRIDLIDQYCYSHSGFIAGTNANSNLVCRRYSSNQILITGYATLAASATLSITVYASIQNSLTVNSTYNADTTITVISDLDNNVVSANTASVALSLAVEKGCNAVSLSGTMERPYADGTAFPLYITFKLKSYTLTNGDYLHVDFGNWVLDPAAAGIQSFKYQVSGSIYWVPAAATLVSGNIYKIPVYNNYTMSAGSTITIWVDTFAPDSYYGAKTNAIQWNTFRIYAYKSSVLREQEIFRVWTQPFGHPSFAVSSVLNYVGATNLYQFSVTPNISAAVGDSIIIEFTTADGLKTTLFSNTLGATIPAPNPGAFDCNQAYNTHVISDTGIQCRVYQGDSTTTPSTPTTIVIPIKKAIPANTLIEFNILNIANAAVSYHPIGVVFKMANTCSYSDQINLCAFYKSVTYMSFVNTPSIPGIGTTGSLTFNPTIVSATNTQHTVSTSYSVSVGDWVKLIYYSQIPIPTVCSITSSNAECYSYPTTNTIMIKALSAQSSYSFTLGGMTNPYQRYYGTNTFYSEVWRNTGSIYTKFYTNYAAATITTDPTSSNPLDIVFTPTLTPDYQLKYDFNNIARIKINHMLQNDQVKLIYINSNSDVSIDTSYCNATLQTYPGEAIPYPFRFVCQSMGSTWVKLNLQSDFPAWTANFTGRNIYIYLRYTITNGQYNYGNYWYSRSYTHLTSTSSNYLVAQGTGRFAIVEYLLPHLYVLSLWTKSFVQRTCTIKQQCMFYGFLLPTTLRTSIDIREMTFLLPKQFKYTTTRTLNKCTLQPTTTQLWTFSCGVQRKQSQITITYTPSSGSYNQGYNLINLDHSDSTQLFTAPDYPGNHYTMQVNLWTTSKTQLAETQYVNITTVYGYYLLVPDITCLIPQDADSMGLFDLTFKVGISDLLPAYDNTASNSITSSIELSFANTFAADLGTGLTAGAEIACLHVSGMTFNTMGRIKCQIYPSTSTITFPTIIITGYDRVAAGSILRIQFADLKTLPAGVTDFCKLGVSLTYFNYGGVKGYIYEPVSFVVGPPTAAATPKAITFTVTETGSSYVGELTDYSFAGSIAAGFTPVTPTDYFVIQFPKYTFEGRFHLNAQALCSLAAVNKCNIFGLAAQIYIQPSATVSVSAFTFTITKLLNAAFRIVYLDRTVKIFTVVNQKVDASGTATFLKFTRATTNVTARIVSVGSIYGGDSGISYNFGFQLNSYLPQDGKITLFFPSIYTSLFTTQSSCYLNTKSQLRAGLTTYCRIINYRQLVIVPNGVLLDQNYEYHFVVTNISNPNMDISSYSFLIQTYYFTSVYQPSIIGRNTFKTPSLSVRTVKECKLQIGLSIYNTQLPADYTLSLICPSPIKEASQLKVYLDWAPSTASGTCSSDANTLYSTQCNILTQYSGNKKLTYMSIYLRQISAQKLITIIGSIPNGNQGTYSLTATITTDAFVYLTATSNSFYITSGNSGTSTTRTQSSSAGTIITASGQAISIKSANYPRNRLERFILTFSVTKPDFIVSTLQIDVPSILKESAEGITCGQQTYSATDNYFNLKARQGTNALACNMNGQKLFFTNLTQSLTNLQSGNFLYLTIEGLMNPDTSVSQTNFTFTFINTSSTYTQAVLRFSLQMSYPVSDSPLNIQIANITVSNPKFYATSDYTFELNSVSGTNFTINKHSQLGLMLHFPPEYVDTWKQTQIPPIVNLTIGGVGYSTTNIRMSTRYIFAIFKYTDFPVQLDFSVFSVSLRFRNTKVAIDCKATPVFTLSLFDFKGNTIYAETLSNNQVCPTFTTHLFDIKVTGNTKVSAGSAQTFYVTLAKPAKNLTITPTCDSSAISFNPATINFLNYKDQTKTFQVIAANGLSGSFNVTFAKQETGVYTFYNDIQYTTLNIYIPTTKYLISIKPFVRKSVGSPIKVRINLAVPSPTEFALLATTDCNSDFVFEPLNRITIPARTKQVIFTVAYKGTTVPPECTQTFEISSLSDNNYALQNAKVYYSAKISIDKTYVESPLLLRLTTTPMLSQDVGHTVISQTSTSTSQYIPKVYSLVTINLGSNTANFTVTTSYIGTIYYAIVPAGSPNTLINQADIYHQNLSSGVTFGEGTADLNLQGVNIQSNFLVSGLNAQKKYKIAIYLNSTVGISPILFEKFKTKRASNAAAIKIAMSSVLTNVTAFLDSLSKVLRIQSTRLYILSDNVKLNSQQTSYQANVMNKRKYIYDVLVAPNRLNDTTAPIDLLKTFKSDTNGKTMLKEFVPEFILSYGLPIRPYVNTVPKIRNPISVEQLDEKKVTISLSFWNPCFVYAVIRENAISNLTSNQIVNGLNENGNAVIPQHYKNVSNDGKGKAVIQFLLLNDNSTYTISVSAQFRMPYPPRLTLDDTQVLTKVIHTRVKTDLFKNEASAVEEIRKQNAPLADKVEQQKRKVTRQKDIRNVNKKQKKRNH